MNQARSARRKCLFRLLVLVTGVAIAVPGTSRRANAQSYRSHAEIGAIVQAAQSDHPDICKWYNLGNSRLGKELWALRISDNVNLYDDEDEPEFKYVSTMHGDEIMGVEMCLYLIDYLTTNYGSDAQVNGIVNEVDLWIVPLMNPDGYEASPRTRYNSAGVDLNRDFPNLYDPNTPWATETQVIMNWVAQHTFTASANIHGGKLVVNYPFDNEDSGSRYTPDDAEFIWMSEEYSRYNLDMWDSTEFFHGITNGVDWYTVHGSMQDWNYHFMGCNDVTIEVSEAKQPQATYIPSFWDDNRESMLAYIETCLTGARGIVSDIDTGDPLTATVTVVGRDHDIFTDPNIGDYHRILRPGTYDLRFESAGYDTIVVPGVVVLEGDATRRDVSVGAPPAVTSPDGGEVLEAGIPTTVTWSGNANVQFHVRYTANADDVGAEQDDFERPSLGDSYNTGGHQPWITTTDTAYGGVRSARAGNISHAQQSWMTRTVNGGDLSFWYRVSSEASYDYFDFYIDGTRMIHRSGTVGWTQYSNTLPTGTHDLKWQYTKDSNTSAGTDTAWIDDLQFAQDNTTWADIVTLTEIGATSVEWTPDGEGTDYRVAVRAYYGGGAYGQWDESTDSFSVLASDPIPAVSTWGIIVMALCTALFGTIILRRNAKLRIPVPAIQKDRTVSSRKSIVVIGLLLTVAASHGARALGGEIHTAARVGDVATINRVIETSPQLVDSRDESGDTPLGLAVAGLHTEVARRLIDAGADTNAKNSRGEAPIHLIALTGGRTEKDVTRRSELVSALIEAGADIRLGDKQGKTALHLAIARARPKLVGRLIEAKAEVNATDALGRTSLHEAAMADHAPTVKLLLTKKADPRVADREGNTPLHLAAMRFRREAAQLLVGAGASVHTKNTKGATPLNVAAASGPAGVKEVDRLLTAVATVLIEAGADVNAEDADGITPLAHALLKQREKLAELLQNHGARR